MTLLVRDEDDIIRANIDFHLSQGVDFIIAMDNLSIDRTPEILREFERKGVLQYVHQPEDDYSQQRWVTGISRMACTEFSADWVINCDADEFWWPEIGNLKSVLAALPASCAAVAVERTNFVPCPMSPNAFFADVMTVRRRQSVNALGAPLPPKICHRAAADIDIEQGNHGVWLHGRRLETSAAPITILHFPMRTYERFVNKIAKGGAAYARNGNLPQAVGATWRQLYETWQAGGLEAHYNEEVLDRAAVERGLALGDLLFDDRLKRYFSTAPYR